MLKIYRNRWNDITQIRHTWFYYYYTSREAKKHTAKKPIDKTHAASEATKLI